MALTDLEVKRAKAVGKPLKLTDGGGMFLLVQINGAKYWRLAYRFDGKQKTLALGVYPDVSLAGARARREDARKLLANNTDPSAVKQAQKSARAGRVANSFEVVAREWFAKKSPGWAASNASKIIQRLENDAFPWLGDRPVAEITPPELLKALRRIEERGAVESAHRVRNYCGAIFRYANRNWFDLARSHLPESDWKCVEVYEGDWAATAPIPIVRPTLNRPACALLDKARELIQTPYVEAAANYARQAFELGVRAACELKRVEMRYCVDPKAHQAQDFLDKLKAWKATGSVKQADWDAAIQRLELLKNVVMNPYSHPSAPNIPKQEVEQAIDAVGNFLKLAAQK